MFANFTEETCTGTGDTLNCTGATAGNIPFSASFEDRDMVSIAVVDGAGIIKVAGNYTYNSPANTFTRNDAWNWNGTVVDKSPATNIALSGGVHTIRCDVSVSSLAGVLPKQTNLHSASQYLPSNAYSTFTTKTAGTGQVLWAEFSVSSTEQLSGLGIDVITLASSDGIAELGLYKMDFLTNTLYLVDKTAPLDLAVATGSVGINTAAFLNGNMTVHPSEPLFVAFATDGVGAVVGGSATSYSRFIPAEVGARTGSFYKNSAFTDANRLPLSQFIDHNKAQSIGVIVASVFGVMA